MLISSVPFGDWKTKFEASPMPEHVSGRKQSGQVAMRHGITRWWLNVIERNSIVAGDWMRIRIRQQMILKNQIRCNDSILKLISIKAHQIKSNQKQMHRYLSCSEEWEWMSKSYPMLKVRIRTIEIDLRPTQH